ncbi:MAG: AbrB/MazE/SpoVT family DNA-binding domain-containing protein [Rhodocyclaceae bacterium]|nr:AbrB/MazE/SpoVT family DNA-binding domain-containing protein [Rhodocyclaceae bacterium]
MLATLTSKGQITIPLAIRKALQLDAGSRLDFVLQDDRSVRVLPVLRDPLSIGNVLPSPSRRRVTDKEIRAAIALKATSSFLRNEK